MSIVEYVQCVCRHGVVLSYISDVFLVAGGYWSARLTYIRVLTCVAFELVNSTGFTVVGSSL